MEQQTSNKTKESLWNLWKSLLFAYPTLCCSLSLDCSLKTHVFIAWPIRDCYWKGLVGVFESMDVCLCNRQEDYFLASLSNYGNCALLYIQRLMSGLFIEQMSWIQEIFNLKLSKSGAKVTFSLCRLSLELSWWRISD